MKIKIAEMIFLIFILISGVKNGCEIGCLKCNKQDECLICNQIEFYYKNSEKSCIKIELENCIEIDKEGKCLTCKEEFYLNFSTRKCLAVETTKKIENCFFYDSNQNCSVCKQDFFLFGAFCKGVKKLIKNCDLYFNETTCLECKEGYVNDLQNSSCVPINSEKENCSYFSVIKCQDCETGFINNENLYFKNKFKSESESDLRSSFELFKQLDKNLFVRNSLCEKILVENCFQPATFETCKICNPGYYLNEKSVCVKNPIALIENCKMYSSYTSCKICENKFYPKSISECAPIEEIPKCVEYDGASSVPNCKYCETSSFYENKNCVTRTKDIKNCNTFDPYSEKCLVCSSGFFLTLDSFNCIQNIANCKEYQNNADIYSCTKCNNGYILNSNKCEKGSLENCDIFSPSSTITTQICEKCVNKFKLVNNTCIKINTIPNCDIYNAIDDKSCLQCKTSYFNFIVNSKCLTLKGIEKCTSYTPGSNPLTCLTCEEGLIPSLDKLSCITIKVPNCAFGPDVNICSKCFPNYAIFNNTCHLPLEHLTLNCSGTDINTKNASIVTSILCEECKPNSLPINHKNAYVCIKNENLAYYFQTKIFCLKYDFEGKCLQCTDGTFLNNNSCESICNTKEINRYNFLNYKTNFCGNLNNSCQSKGPRIDDGIQICLKCKDGFIPVDVGYGNNSFTNFNRGLDLNIIDNPREMVYELNCVDLNGKNINQGATTSGLIDGCELYRLRSGDDYDCVRCKDFYTGEIEGNNYIKSCSLESDFEQIKKFGMDLVWEKLFSGYQCKDTTKIPYLAYIESGTNDAGAIPLKITNINVSKGQTAPNTTPLSKNVFCSLSTPNYATNESIPIPSDCGLGVYRLTSNKTFRAFYCAACKPGYKPISNTNISIAKNSCILIPHCIGKDWFNSCSECSEAYTYKYDTNVNDIDYTICWSYPLNNDCYASNSDGQCVICKKGFYLNADNICDKILSPNCESSDYFVSELSLINLNPKIKAYTYFLLQNSLGCTKCKFGYTPVVVNTSDYYLCSNSEYIKKNNLTLPSDSNYVKFCDNYFFHDGEFKCKKCQSDKLLDFTEKKCFNLIPNCLQSHSEDKCNYCQEGYALVKNTCLKAEIENCALYYQSTDKNSIYCQTCSEGYYKEVDELSCKKSSVLNCKIVTGLQTCQKCKDEYVLIETNSFHYCYPLDSFLECKKATFKNNEIYGAEVTCDECKTINQIIVSPPHQEILFNTLCMKFEEIPHCKEYNTTTQLQNSSFYCLECESDFYVNHLSGICSKRQAVVEGCVKYSLNEDKCFQCNDTSFLDETRKKCLAFPTGIVNCEEYKSEKECIRCGSGFYLGGVVCKKVEEANIIENCIHYSNPNTCKECASNYILIEKKCIKSTIENCEKYVNEKQCEICKEGYGIKDNGDKILCNIVVKAKCLLFSQKDPYPCVVCEPHYYVDFSGFCVAADPKIDNCEIYKSNEQCEKCIKGTVMSFDKKSCQSLPVFTTMIPDNCEESIETSPFCSICKPGFYFKDNKCSSCTSNSVDKGCFSCNPINEEECFLCAPDYYMNKEGKCFSIHPVICPSENLEGESFLIIYLLPFFILLFR